MEEYQLPNKGLGWRTSRGQLGVWMPSSTLIVARVCEHGEGDFAGAILGVLERSLTTGARPQMFFDFELMSSYDSSFRTALTERLIQHRSRIDGLAILARSRVVQMGVAVVNLALGGFVTAYADRERFTSSLDEALRAAKVVGVSSGTFLSAAAAQPTNPTRPAGTGIT